MGSNPEPEAEQERRVAKLPLFSLPPLSIQSPPDHSGIRSPPIFTTSVSASVPFRWEEFPGKPRHISNGNTCTALTISSAAASGGGAPPKCLELPPRLLLMDAPYSNYRAGSMRFQSSSSFRMMTSPRYCYGSTFSPEGMHLGALVLRKRGGGFVREISGWFGSWRRRRTLIKAKREASGGGGGGGGGSVFPSTAENTPTSPARILRRNESFSRHAKARHHFWGSMSEGLKQAVPSWLSSRKKKKMKEERGLVVY